MALILTSGPAVEPVSLAEAKLHLRIESTDTNEDNLLSALIKAAREMVERESRHALITQSWRLVRDSWPDEVIELPLPPLQSVASVQYIDDADVTYTLSSSVYEVDTSSTPGRVILKRNQTWPTTTLAGRNGVRVNYTCGFGTAGSNVDEALRLAMKLLIASWYEHREDYVIGTTRQQLPFAVRALLGDYRQKAAMP